jgi:hypothetical protein
MSHIAPFVGPSRMGLLALTTDFWALFWTTVVTVLLLVPGVAFAWYVVDDWIGGDSYANVVASVDRGSSQTGN